MLNLPLSFYWRKSATLGTYRRKVARQLLFSGISLRMYFEYGNHAYPY